MPTTVTKPPILDETGINIVAQIKRIADAKEANLMGYGGAITFSSLPSPTSSNLGLFYLITDAFTTTSDFVVGAGVSEPAGKYWAVINIGTQAAPVCKYDEMGTLVDLSAKQDKTMSSSVTIDGVTESSVEGAISKLATLSNGNKSNLANKADLLDIAPAFDSTATYTKGDYVTYTDGDVYRFTAATHTGAWAVGDVTKVNVGNELKLRQNKTLDTPLTIGGTSRTTVEDALGALNQSLTTDYWLSWSQGGTTVDYKTLMAGDTSVSFIIPDNDLAYELYVETQDGTNVSVNSHSVNTTTMELTFNISAITSAQANVKAKCRVIV